MKSLERLHGGESTPVDGIDVPNSNWTHDTTDAVTKKSDRDGTQNDGNGTQRQVVKEVLSGKDLDTSGSVRGRCRRDGTNGVLLERPWPGIDEVNGRDPLGTVALATFRPPSSLKLVSTRKEGSPRLAEEIGDKDDKGA